MLHSAGLQPTLTTDVVHELTRSLLLAASRHHIDDTQSQPMDRTGPDSLAPPHNSSSPISISVSADNSSSQAVHDLLLLASPLSASGQPTTNSFSFIPTTAQLTTSSSSGGSSLTSNSDSNTNYHGSGSVQPNKRKRGDVPSPSASSRSHNSTGRSVSSSSSSAVDEDDERRRQIRRDALASVHKARQLAATHFAAHTLSTTTAAPSSSSNSAGSSGSALLCAEDAMDESSSAASNLSSTSDVASSASSLHSLPELSNNTSPNTSPAPSDDSHSPTAAPLNHTQSSSHLHSHAKSHSQHDDEDSEAAHTLPLSAPPTNGQHAALEEFSLFLKKMRAVHHRSQHYTLAPSPHDTSNSVGSAREQQQAEA